MDADALALVQFETIQETAHTAPPSIERPPIFFSNVDDDDDEEIEKEITKPSSCLFCYLFPTTAATIATSNLEANNVEEAEIEPSKEEPEGEPVAPAPMAEQRMAKETTEMPPGTEREAVTMQDAKEALIEKSATKESAPGPITSEKSDHKEMESTDQDDVANVASTDKQQVDNKESPDASADEKEPADEELEESDAISVLLSKLDRRIFPWLCRTEEEDEKPLETEQTKKDTPGDDSSRKVRFAEEVKVDDDDEIVERADAHNATKECMLKESVQPSALGKFLEWLTAIEVSAASLTGTNDARCQPLNKLSESENPDRVFSCVMDPKIPTEINFLNCNADDSTVLTTDPSFPACGNLKTTVQEKPRPMPKFLFRRDGKVLPILTPPFLRKAPVNKER